MTLIVASKLRIKLPHYQQSTGNKIKESSAEENKVEKVLQAAVRKIVSNKRGGNQFVKQKGKKEVIILKQQETVR